MADDLVSAIIPTCNRPGLVTRAVASALSQTYGNIEVVVVIDGPDQSTALALQSVGDARLRVISLPERTGGGGARNAGVEIARGEWVAFLDDDDEWLPEKLEVQVAAAVRMHARYPVVTSRVLARTPGRDYIWPSRLISPHEHISEYLLARKTLFFGEALMPTPTIFTRRALLLEVPFGSGLKKHQDWDWYLRAARIEGVSFDTVPEPLAIVHWEEQKRSITSSHMWRYSLDWIRSRKEHVTRRAYAAFISTQVSSQAAIQADWQAFWPLLKEMFQSGDPRTLDVLLYLSMWLIPQNLRRRIRGLLAQDRGQLLERP